MEMECLGGGGIEMESLLHRLVSRFEIAARQRRARQVQLMLDRFLKSSGMNRMEGRENKECATESKDGRNLNPAA